MNWILDNLQLVIIVASAFAWWLTQRRQSSREDQRPPTPPDEPPFDADERARRIQEEIRRRIAERQAEAAGRKLEPPPLVLTPAPPPTPVRRMEPEWTHADTAALERQRRLEDEMRALEAQRRAARSSAQLATGIPGSITVRSMESSRIGGDGDLIRVLRDRRSLRQAVILREVLGPPVALRGKS